MQALILAGGRGERLKPLTDNTPKSMVRVNGRPFLEYQLALLKNNGITEILLLTGYLGEKIEEYFGDGRKFGFDISYSREEKFLGTAGAIKQAEGKLQGQFLLLNGDTYLDINYAGLIEFFQWKDKIGVLTVYPNQERIAANNVRLGPTRLILDYSNQKNSLMDCVDAGAAVFKKELTRLIEPSKTVSLQEEIFTKLIAQKELASYPAEKRFYDIGTLKGLKLLEEVLG